MLGFVPTQPIIGLRKDDTQVTELLLPRIARGEAAAVPACLERYGGLVAALARRFLGTDTDDAVQEIFVELWRCADRYDPTRSAENTFVTMIARRKLIDYRRRQGRQPIAETLVNDAPAAYQSPGDSLALADDAAQAVAALRQLRPEQQDGIRMAICDGLTHEEIATRTGQPLGTVKTNIRRGLLRLREFLHTGRDA
ncbi:MAG: RNA polymerase sigma factor [Gemmataceae bacterium]